MGLELLNSLDDMNQLWRYYWILAVAVWVLAWIGVRRWLWWGIAAPLLGLVAGLAFTTGTTISGGSAPMAMIAALSFLSDTSHFPINEIKPILLNSAIVAVILAGLHLITAKLRRTTDPAADGAVDEGKQLINERIEAFKEELEEDASHYANSHSDASTPKPE